ncbi:hypothetical protein [Streptomyces collinus]
MTPAGRAAYALHGLLLIAALLQGAAHLHLGNFAEAAAAYLVVLACLVAMGREASRTALEEPREPGRLTCWWLRLRATWQARRILRAEECTCDAVWWPGDNHEAYCPSAQRRRLS